MINVTPDKIAKPAISPKMAGIVAGGATSAETDARTLGSRASWRLRKLGQSKHGNRSIRGNGPLKLTRELDFLDDLDPNEVIAGYQPPCDARRSHASEARVIADEFAGKRTEQRDIGDSALLLLPWLLGWSGTTRMFYVVAGAVILTVWVLSAYRTTASSSAV
jgi:hypothetical protein